MSLPNQAAKQRIFPVFIPMQGCGGACLYCDQTVFAPAPNFEQLQKQLQGFASRCLPGQGEIAFFGGTFTALRPAQRQQYYNLVKPWLGKISGIRISTRPDKLDEHVMQELVASGVTTIELGVQSFNSSVLAQTGRPYTGQQAINACKLVNRFNLNLGIQLMPGLPGATNATALADVEQAIALNPAFVRVYPLIVITGTKLHQLWQQGGYTPLTTNQAVELCANLRTTLQQAGINVAKMGLHGDIDPSRIAAGPYHPRFGELVLTQQLLQRIVLFFSASPGNTIVLNQAEAGLLTAAKKEALVKLKAMLGVANLKVKVDNTIPRGTHKIVLEQP